MWEGLTESATIRQIECWIVKPQVQQVKGAGTVHELEYSLQAAYSIAG